MDAQACARCQRPCDSAFLMVGAKNYHPACLTCTHCNERLQDGFCEHEQKPYCLKHYRILFGPKCAECHDVLEGAVMEVNGQQFHPHCFRCGYCGENLKPGSSLSMVDNLLVCTACAIHRCFKCKKMTTEFNRARLQGLEFHRRCLTCETCQIDLPEADAQVFNNRVYCEQHAREKRGSSVDLAKGCQGCGKTIVSQAVLAMDAQWHKDCFRCGHCKELLTGPFVPHEGKPYCHDDFVAHFGPKCAACTGPIDGKYLEIEGQQFHEPCIRCRVCKAPCLSDMFADKQRRIHVQCASCHLCGKSFASSQDGRFSSPDTSLTSDESDVPRLQCWNCHPEQQQQQPPPPPSEQQPQLPTQPSAQPAAKQVLPQPAPHEDVPVPTTRRHLARAQTQPSQPAAPNSPSLLQQPKKVQQAIACRSTTAAVTAVAVGHDGTSSPSSDGSKPSADVLLQQQADRLARLQLRMAQAEQGIKAKRTSSTSSNTALDDRLSE